MGAESPITLYPLGEKHGALLAKAMRSEEPSYSQYFTPFEPEDDVVSAMLGAAERDLFCGLSLDGEFVGFYMLRGLDDGYEVPAFGLWIASAAAGLGLGQLCLRHAIATCRALGLDEIMLKVHPSNQTALRLYQANGFAESGHDESNGNLVMRKPLSSLKKEDRG